MVRKRLKIEENGKKTIIKRRKLLEKPLKTTKMVYKGIKNVCNSKKTH
jgi:hypothetical protein